MQRYATIEKKVGETPLITTERLRAEHSIPQETPLAYAGRLDPMASGKLLILIGDECKKQEKYHSFDKEYLVEVIFGISSDTGDVLGFVTSSTYSEQTENAVRNTLNSLVTDIELPYPHFSSKTIQGKPLHTWALEKRLSEITIPIKKSRIYNIKFNSIRTVTKDEVLNTVRTKIETIPKVTDPRKALGADFRRDDVRAHWNEVEHNAPQTFQIISFSCIASSGTYMRSLAEKIAHELGTTGLAYSIHRTQIGRYLPFTKKYGIWIKKF